MEPTVGRIVRYTLTSQDAENINRRRGDFSAYLRKEVLIDRRKSGPGNPPNTGHIGHFGSHVEEGDVLAALIVRVTNGVNLKVFLDGNDDLYVPGVKFGPSEGQWHWTPQI